MPIWQALTVKYDSVVKSERRMTNEKTTTHDLALCFLVCLSLFVFAACGEGTGEPTEAPTNAPTDAPDPCANGHTEVIDPAVAPTCEEAGLTEGKHCSVCNTVLIAQSEIAATGHDLYSTEVNYACKNCDFTATFSTELTHKANYDGTTCTITGIGICTDTELYIPQSINGYTVTIIGERAFDGCSSLTSVAIPDGVTSIGPFAFNDCSSLTSVTLPDSLTYIGSSMFYGCSSLTSVTIPDGVTSIGSRAFYDCSSLTDITIPDSVTSIGGAAFKGCSSLIQKEHGVSYVDKWVIDCDTDVTSVILRENTVGIAYSVFSNCTELNTVYFGGAAEDWKITRIDSSNSHLTNATFYYYSEIQPIVFGKYWHYVDNVATLWNVAEYISNQDGTCYVNDFSGAGDFVIPSVSPNGDRVTSIGKEAFAGCSGMTSITIGDNVTSIGDYAFSGCSGLTTIAIPDSVTSIGDAAFSVCSGLTGIVIPNSVTSIGDYTFSGCSGLTTIAIPDSVTSIGDYAFRGCSGLTTIAIPDSVTSIGDYAFRGCSGLTTIAIPDSVTSIGGAAFSDCSNLTSIKISDGVTSIGWAVFAGCSNLKSITIPNSVTSIGYNAFRSCDSLESITLPFVGARKDGTSDTRFAYVFTYEGESNRSEDIPASLKTVVITGDTGIGENAFMDCSGLTSIILLDGVTSIGDFAFAGCSGLTSIVIPDSVTRIGSHAFRNCRSLESITLPFVGASKDGLTKTHFGYIFGAPGYSENRTYIPTSLKTVVITGGTSIASSAFNNCNSIESITLPKSVTSIGNSAFKGCTKLNTVNYVGTEAEWQAISGLDQLPQNVQIIYNYKG